MMGDTLMEIIKTYVDGNIEGMVFVTNGTGGNLNFRNEQKLLLIESNRKPELKLAETAGEGQHDLP